MELVLKFMIGAAVCAATAALVILVKGLVYTPVRRYPEAEVAALVRVHGDAEGLEQAVEGLKWLRDSGRAELEIIISDCGMAPEAARRAEILALREGVRIVGEKL